MTSLRAYGGGVATCICERLPHAADCPAAPFFAEEEALTIDDDSVDHPFILQCPRGHRFLQTEHTLKYDYRPLDAATEQMELPLVCPHCGHSDKQTLPVLVGHNPFEVVENDPVIFEHFKIECPSTSCGWIGDRTEGVIDIWLEKAVVKGCISMYIPAHNRDYLKGEVYAEYTALSITCPECGWTCGEDAK